MIGAQNDETPSGQGEGFQDTDQNVAIVTPAEKRQRHGNREAIKAIVTNPSPPPRPKRQADVRVSRDDAGLMRWLRSTAS